MPAAPISSTNRTSAATLGSLSMSPSSLNCLRANQEEISMDASPATPSSTATIAALTLSLAPAFTAGLAVQQALHILESVTPGEISPERKRAAGGIISLVLGMWFSFGAHIHTLQILLPNIGSLIDGIVTGFIISAGTE